MLKTVIFVILIYFVVYSLALEVVCRDEQNKFVDWFYLYKLPFNFSEQNNNLRSDNGLRYIYLSSNNIQNGWQLSPHLIDELTSFPGQTISAISAVNTTLLLAYNDEAPDGTVYNSGGHTKGIIAADDKTGFWLIHSVPKYPDIEQTYSYPKTAVHYGQSFLCISFNSSQIDLVAEQQIFNEPNVYFSRIPESLKSKYPNIVKVVDKAWRTEPPFWNDIEITSITGTSFRSFAKGHRFNKELYEDYVAPALDDDLLVETWRHGTGILPSNCTQRNRVYNVASLNMTGINFSFHSTADHSKWAVSKQSKKWICVGDINRAEHQLNRGGGTVCQLNTAVAEFYQKLIYSIEPCQNNI